MVMTFSAANMIFFFQNNLKLVAGFDSSAPVCSATPLWIKIKRKGRKVPRWKQRRVPNDRESCAFPLSDRNPIKLIISARPFVPDPNHTEREGGWEWEDGRDKWVPFWKRSNCVWTAIKPLKLECQTVYSRTGAFITLSLAESLKFGSICVHPKRVTTPLLLDSVES